MSVLRSAAFAALGLVVGLQGTANAGGGVTISSYGQRALLIQGGGQSVLLPLPGRGLCRWSARATGSGRRDPRQLRTGR